jgi:cyanate permease
MRVFLNFLDLLFLFIGFNLGVFCYTLMEIIGRLLPKSFRVSLKNKQVYEFYKTEIYLVIFIGIQSLNIFILMKNLPRLIASISLS